jgi:cyclic pyranopterin phosphate synthase
MPGPRAGQGQHGRQGRHERRPDPADGAPLQGHADILRFIEYMDVGASNGWNMDRSDSVGRSGAPHQRRMPLEPVGANYTGETAARWRYVDGGGEVGVISSVTQAFCKDCSRARLSTEGKLYTCLFATRGHDLRALLREGRSDAEISTVPSPAVAGAATAIPRRAPSIPSGLQRGARKVEMSYIGGIIVNEQHRSAA